MSTMPRRSVVPDAFNLRRLYPSTWVPLGTDRRHLDSCATPVSRPRQQKVGKGCANGFPISRYQTDRM